MGWMVAQKVKHLFNLAAMVAVRGLKWNITKNTCISVRGQGVALVSIISL